jgi:CheY-like chemotaxis protein
MEYNSVKILITDDDHEDLELIEEAILNADRGAVLQKFTDGKTALKFLDSTVEKDLPCLILLDYSMPEMNGSEMLSYIKENARYNHIPKVVLSTSDSPLHIHECISNGATEYLVKPNNIKGLQALAKKLLTLCSSF